MDDDDTISFWVSASGQPTGDGSQQNPFDSLAMAQQAVRDVLQSPVPLDRDIVVSIGDGTYQLSQPLSFDARDSGRDGHVVHYRAVNGEHPVISGGTAVTGWTPVANPGLTLPPGAQLWQASVDPGVDSRQLYIDGARATVAETNADTTYPVGFRPSYQEDPGVSGIKYATNIVGNPNSSNWADPTTWGNVGDIHDVQAVIYSQWKMISVPVQEVQAADPLTSVGLIKMVDPAWTNANLIRNAPLAETVDQSRVITMVDNGTQDYLAKVGTYFGNITAGMTVTGRGLPTDRTVTVTSVDPVTHQVTLSDAAVATTAHDQPVGLTFTDPATQAVVTTNPNEWSFWRVSKFVNAYEFLDQPNEWYLDRTTGKIYVVAHAGDDPNLHDIQLPVLEKLIDGNGASNLSFEGLQFKYATWLDPSKVTATADPLTHIASYTGDGYVVDQSAFHLTGDGHEANLIGHFQQVDRTPGNISFDNGNNITFEGNSFSHLGGVGLDLSGGAQDNRVAYNIFNDISSSAIVLGGVSAADARPATAAGVVQNNDIIGNYLSKVAAEYYDAAGIFVGYSKNARVSGNFISDVPWAGIMMGWGWGLRDQGGFPGLDWATPNMWGVNTTPTIMQGNKITDNTITRFLQKLWDTGAIYTSGSQDGDIGNPAPDGTLIARNYAYDKTAGGGGNVFYTDGGSRFLELDGNISFGNDQSYVNFGPAFAINDTLNASDPMAVLPILNYLVPYGSDIGGVVTYGDIQYSNNYWQNLWGSLQPTFDPMIELGEFIQLAEEMLIYNQLVKDNYAQWPFTPLYFDPVQYTDANGTAYPTSLSFIGDSNKIIDGLGSINTSLLSGLATTSNTLAFVKETPVLVARVDAQGGEVTFGVLSLADGHTTVLLGNAIGRSGSALGFNQASGGNWQNSEGQPQGSFSSTSIDIGTGVWLPTATLDGSLPLPIVSVHVDGNGALATFEGGIQASFTLGGSRSIANANITDHLALTVGRLGFFNNGLALYEADATTGQIDVNGAHLLPGDSRYLQGALANARAAGLVIDASHMPSFGQQATFNNLSLNDAKSYGLLLMVQNDPNQLFSSYSAANPGGATQMVAYGDDSGHGVTFGIEDLFVLGGRSDRDYNDLIVHFHSAGVLV